MAIIFLAVLIGFVISTNQNGEDPGHAKAEHLGENAPLEDLGGKGIEPSPAIFREDLANAKSKQPLEPLDSPEWIEGQVSFAAGTSYPGLLSSLKVVTLSDGFPKALEKSVGTYQGKLLLFPVLSDGTFRIPVSDKGQTFKLGAVGPLCVAVSDVTAKQGEPVQIPMHFVYGLSTSFVEAGSGVPVAGNVGWIKKYSSYGIDGDGAWGVRSDLSKAYLLQGQPTRDSEAGLINRHIVTLPFFNAEGVGLNFTSNEVGFKSKKGKLSIPPIDGAIKHLNIELDRSGGDRCSIQLAIERIGDWEAYSGYDYFSLGKLLLRNKGEDRFVLSQIQCNLSPGTIALHPIPLDDPEFFLLLCSELNLDQSIYDGAFWELNLEQAPSDPLHFSATVRSSQIGAIAVPPTTPNETGHAWFGVRLQGQSMISSRRYDAASGFLFDGLVPGVYDVFWSGDGVGNGREFRAMTSSNSPLVELTVLPGINHLLLP